MEKQKKQGRPEGAFDSRNAEPVEREKYEKKNWPHEDWPRVASPATELSYASNASHAVKIRMHIYLVELCAEKDDQKKKQSKERKKKTNRKESTDKLNVSLVRPLQLQN